ncbi:MAG: DNA polymerase IV, partial [bacterium]|nr:DNA polymerase IV [bacterium]
LFRYCRGIDERPVRLLGELGSATWRDRVSLAVGAVAFVSKEVDRLAEGVAASLGKRELSAGTITVKVRYSDFQTVTRSLTLSVPTSEAEVLRATAQALLGRTEAGRRPVRLLGVGCSNLSTAPIEQLRLFAGG